MRTRPSLRNKYLLGCTLILALLIGGGTQRGLYTDSIIIVFTLLAAVLVMTSVSNQQSGRAQIIFPAAMLLLCVLQVFPLPSGLLSWFRPDFLDRPIGLEANFTFISLNVGRTFETLVLISAPITFFWCVLRLRPDQVAGLLPFFFLGLFCNLLVSVVQYSLPTDAVVQDLLPFTIHAGLFANANHFSTLLFISIPLIVYFGIYKGQLLTSGIGIVAILLLLLATDSRAGILIGMSVVVISFLALWGKSRITLAGAISLFVLLGIFGIGALSKIDTGSLDPDFGRMEFARSTLEGIRENWLLGVGFGNFETAYQVYENPEMIFPRYVNHAHNEYLELMFEGGIAASILIVIYIFLVFRAALLSEASKLQRAAFISIIFILIHSLVDYPLRTLAIAMSFAFLNGILFHKGLHVSARKRSDLLQVEHNGERIFVPIARESGR